MKKTLLIALSVVATTAVFADATIIEHTKTWQSVPITIDEEAHTYTTVESATLPSSDYYYTYPGYRCIKEKLAAVGNNVVLYRSGTAGGNDIYCYPAE